MEANRVIENPSKLGMNSEVRPRIRVAVAILDGEKILLVEHTKSQRSYWLLPGGGLDWGERLEEAAKREVLEETGIEVDLGKLLFVCETLAPDRSRHLVHLVFSGRPTGGHLTVPQEERITALAWHSLKSLQDLDLHPPIQGALMGLPEQTRKNSDSVFLGNLWVE